VPGERSGPRSDAAVPCRKAEAGWPQPGWRRSFYRVIFESDTRAGRGFDIALILAIVASVVVVVADSVAGLRSRWGGAGGCCAPLRGLRRGDSHRPGRLLPSLRSPSVRVKRLPGPGARAALGGGGRAAAVAVA